MDFYGVNVQHGVDFFARDVYSSWLAALSSFGSTSSVTLRLLVSTFSAPRLVLKVLTSFRPSSMASNPKCHGRAAYLNVRANRSWIHFRRDQIRAPFDRVDHQWSLRSLCLHSYNQFALIGCRHDMSHSSWWRLAVFTALLLASHPSPSPSSI